MLMGSDDWFPTAYRFLLSLALLDGLNGILVPPSLALEYYPSFCAFQAGSPKSLQHFFLLRTPA